MQDPTSHPGWTGKAVKLEDRGAVAEFQRRYGLQSIDTETDTVASPENDLKSWNII